MCSPECRSLVWPLLRGTDRPPCTCKTSAWLRSGFEISTPRYPCAGDQPTPSPAPLQVATRLGKKSDAAPKFTETTSPLKRRLSDFGKAVASAITRDNTTFLEIETEPGRIESGGEGQRGNGDVFPTPRAAGKGGTSLSIGRFTAGVAGMSPRSPAERRRTVSDDADFGVQVDELSW